MGWLSVAVLVMISVAVLVMMTGLFSTPVESSLMYGLQPSLGAGTCGWPVKKIML
jgi:hypothetical protein